MPRGEKEFDVSRLTKVSTNSEARWAQLAITDLRYTQDTCSDVFAKSSPHLETPQERSIERLRQQLGGNPDEVLQTLGISPEVVCHGDMFVSVNNRRTYCIRNCTAPKETMIWVRLYANPGAFDRQYGPGAFERYYSTTNEGQHIHVTKHHHKGDGEGGS